jgi:hypothetical protein
MAPALCKPAPAADPYAKIGASGLLMGYDLPVSSSIG